MTRSAKHYTLGQTSPSPTIASITVSTAAHCRPGQRSPTGGQAFLTGQEGPAAPASGHPREMEMATYHGNGTMSGTSRAHARQGIGPMMSKHFSYAIDKRYLPLLVPFGLRGSKDGVTL